jgi:hypothetical protein
MTSLAQLQEQLRKQATRQEEKANIAGMNEKGFTSDFSPEGRQKYKMLMEAIGLVGTAQAEKTLAMLRENFGDDPKKIGGYWCYNCEYFTDKPSSPTGHFCKQYLFPDKPFECCNGWEGLE